MLMAEPQTGQVGRDRTSFFIFPRAEVAPVVYDYAFKMVEGKTPDQMPGVLHETFTKTIQGARSMAPDTIGPGYYALMRLDEFIPSRVVEAVVHGLDLTDAVGRGPIATPEGVAMTAAILDDLLARKTSRADRRTWPTTWPGCGRRREEATTPTPACRSSDDQREPLGFRWMGWGVAWRSDEHQCRR
jgi:hypothetical protein